ncbi:MAG: MFS transporter [Granulosicoccus sp.]|nr:MFS transporter [Granulosicoccus sp.]
MHTEAETNPISPLAHREFRLLLCAQICSLLAVGLLTVAVALVAWRLGGEAAGGRILGLLLALKMVAYVVLAPLAEPLFAKRSRKHSMIILNAGRLLLVLPMSFATSTWQIAILLFAFFALTAAFTPLFQSLIPDMLTDDDSYSRALAWSRIAYTLESIMSPVIAAILLPFVEPAGLFVLAAVMLGVSALLIVATHFPQRPSVGNQEHFLKRALKGMNVFWQTPRLGGLFLLNLALSMSMAWVLVNTVVYAGGRLQDAEGSFPLLMLFYGLGAAACALLVPRLITRIGERRVILFGVFGFAAVGITLVCMTLIPVLSMPSVEVERQAPSMAVLFLIWAGFGFASSLVITPGGLVIKRSAPPSTRPSLFAAQFSLSHAGWMIAYPLAGWLAGIVSLELALLLLCAVSILIAVVASFVWPADDTAEREHEHPELPADHPHLTENPTAGPGHRHIHVYYIDELHPRWVD